MGQQPMDARDADIVNHIHAIAQETRGERSLLGDGQVARAGGEHQDLAISIRLGQSAHHATAGGLNILERATQVGEVPSLRLVEPRDKDALLAALAHGTDDARDLTGSLTRTVDDLGHARAKAALHVYARVAEIGRRTGLDAPHQFVRSHTSARDVAGESF